MLRHRLPNVQHGGTVALQLSSRGPGDAADYEEAMRISGLIPPNCDLRRTPGASVSSLQILICNHNTQLFELRTIREEEKRAEAPATPPRRLIKGDSLISEISASKGAFEFPGKPTTQPLFCCTDPGERIKANILQIPEPTSSRCRQQVSWMGRAPPCQPRRKVNTQ